MLSDVAEGYICFCTGVDGCGLVSEVRKGEGLSSAREALSLGGEKGGVTVYVE